MVYTVTQVYLVEADSPLAARALVDAWQTTHDAVFGVVREFESTRPSPGPVSEPATRRPGNPWLTEVKRQLLGEPPEQPARSKRQS